MDEGARRWLIKTAKKHYWRLSVWYDFDDLIQEGFYAYYYMTRRYPKVKNPAHRMALFKLVFNSVICNLANQRTRRTDEVCVSQLFADSQDPDRAASTFLEGVAAEPDIAEAIGALTSAPEYVRRAVALFATEAGLRQLRHTYRRVPVGPRHKKRHKRETLNERLCRLTGYDPAQTDIVGGIRACLSED